MSVEERMAAWLVRVYKVLLCMSQQRVSQVNRTGVRLCEESLLLLKGCSRGYGTLSVMQSIQT